ncbi:Hpt domain-containing protein [Paenibacillus wenxiniae]|uniref:Hpt domain-containing protein n=1 Tax=Paenibacillus wenxiniae TaxID=1636843 RepID=A0ABW4REX5_9BACL
MSKAERYRQIIEQTRVRFLQDAAIKMHDMHQSLQDYNGLEAPDADAGQALAHQIHRHVHAIKGLALTLSYSGIDELCGDMVNYILNDSSRIWKREHVDRLQQQVDQLGQLIDEATASANKT